MKRQDFVCTIGFQGDTAIVDGVARKRYGSKSAEELLDEGLYRYAFCAALYDQSLDDFLERYRRVTETDVPSVEALKRQFGVFDVPDDITRINVIS